jgi:hypothetical protein
MTFQRPDASTIVLYAVVAVLAAIISVAATVY